MSRQNNSYFWSGYADLMTSMFFIMLVLFVLAIILLKHKMKITTQQLEKIEEIEQATQNIDTKYFDYNEAHKKHILRIQVNFPMQVADINSIGKDAQWKLMDAGESIKNLIESNTGKYGIQYLLVIEGQASKDRWGEENNYVLSYKRALSLRNLWKDIDFGDKCEVLISGSGEHGVLRDNYKEERNQRFLIHLIPKPGIIEASKN